ncbi:hypothetical protein KRP22_010716 [Phytophthora ramorum]|nr:hypothetical protein KRP22_5412 [Phytophthora ramorum]
MTTFARRGAMPHHHVPEPKETPPVVHRLRLELNRTVRRRVTEAVDAVCVAFEDELTHLVAPSVEANDTYEFFYDCCSRLAQFIDNNMDTTPGFLQQMDRLIFACHSGASGSALHSVMTKNLRIRRRDGGVKEMERDDVKVESVVAEGENEENNHSEEIADSGYAQIDEAAPASYQQDAAVTVLNGSDSRSIRGASQEDGHNETQERDIDDSMLDKTKVQQIPPTYLVELKYPVATEVSLTKATDLQIEGGGHEAPAESDHEDAVSESDHELPVPGLCDAGMRPPQQVIHFKACLRKSVQFVDAVLCKPPPGKICIRNCQKIRSRQCREGVMCRDPLCRNWHQAEAHTERCKNPLCEFRNRILLREIMHQIANEDTQIRLLSLQWEEKCMESIVATTDSSSKSYTEDELAHLHDEIVQLERRIDNEKEESESLKNTRRVILANLSAIGVKPQDDEADGFPDYAAHYK